MSLGENVRNLLEERNMTQKELAKALNIAASTLGGYIQGYSEPDFETLKSLASYFSVSTDYLLDFPSDHANTKQQEELLRIFDALTEEQQEIYLEQGRTFLKVNYRKGIRSSKLISHGKNNAG